jgi:hypothetical protein
MHFLFMHCVGDSISAAHQLIQQPRGTIDVLVADYLAELSMGILAKKKARTGCGYVQEFVTFVWKPLLQEIKEKGICIVTNAGGLDPIGLKQEMEDVSLLLLFLSNTK